MPLSKKQLDDVCLCHSGDYRTCRYLREIRIDGVALGNQYYCQKLRPDEKKKLDEKLDKFVKDCKKRNLDPIQQNIPMGDNCPGYAPLKLVKQGYDVP
jgi:hypothetical protein